MNPAPIIARLEAFGATLPTVVAPVSDADARFKPPSGAWSILEIVNHLVDEESDDFRIRLELTLRDPALPFPRTDPEAWARDRRYNERDLSDSVARFVTERRKSIAWLKGLREPDWTRAHQHPRVGPLPAGLFLASWAAHDALHLRQIAKRFYELAARDGDPYPVNYAGEWGP